MKGILFRLGAWTMAAGLIFLSFSSTHAQPTVQDPVPGRAAGSPLFPAGAALSTAFNTNLLINGDAEQGSGNSIPGWVDDQGYTRIVSYSTGGAFPSPYDPGPTERGSSFFFEGNTTNQTTQTNMWQSGVSLTAAAAQIDTGRVRYILSGYFGGSGSFTDTARLRLFFHDSTGAQNHPTITIGAVTAAERLNKTGLVYRQATGYIPAGTRDFDVLLQSGPLDGDNNRYGFADNLSLILLPFQVHMPLTQRSGTAAPSPSGPPAPSNVTAVSNGLTRMDVTWTDNTSGTLGFQVERMKTDGTFERICNTDPGETYCLDQGQTDTGYYLLDPSTTYTYRVRGSGSAGVSAWTTGSGTTAPAATSVPNGTMTCQTIDTTPTSTTLVWTDPFNDPNNNETYFSVEIFIAPGDFQPLANVLENGTSVTVIDLMSGMPVIFRVTPWNDAGDGVSCVTPQITIPGASGVSMTRFNNNTSYPIISLQVDGVEEFPVSPLGILSGSYYEMTLPTGQHSYTLTTGFWRDDDQRFNMYTHSGSFSQPSGTTQEINVTDITIENLLTQFQPQGYWEGFYFDQNANCYTSAFVFKEDGTYTSYNKGSPAGSGTYSVVQRMPAIFSTKFQISGPPVYQSILIETHGQFSMDNGPSPTWRTITYTYKPQGYVRNPFCP